MKLILIINLLAVVAAYHPNRCTIHHYSHFRPTQQCIRTNCRSSRIMSDQKAAVTVKTHFLQCTAGFVVMASAKCQKLAQVITKCGF